jgi:hypothetical protein
LRWRIGRKSEETRMPPPTNQAKSVAHRRTTWSLRPQATGAAALLTAVGALTVCASLLPPDLVLPAMSILFFILAAGVGLIAGSRSRAAEETGLTHCDLAGLLTFIGICAASQVDPDQMVRLMEGANREP